MVLLTVTTTAPGAGVSVAVAVGVSAGVAVPVGSGDAVPVEVAVLVAEAVGVTVGVLVAVGVAMGPGVGVGQRGESLVAVTSPLFKNHVNGVPSNSTVNTASWTPGRKVVGCPRSPGGGMKWFLSPIGASKALALGLR
jgi:hypothetical protein